MSLKLLIRKNTFEEGKVSYSAVISARDTEGNRTATAYVPVNFKKDNMPDDKYVSFLIETDNFFLSAYPVDLPEGKKGGKPKIIICEYEITKDFTEQNVEFKPINGSDDDTLPF